MVNWTEEQLAEHQQRRAASKAKPARSSSVNPIAPGPRIAAAREIANNKKRNKYGAKPGTVNGIRFDSRLEAGYYLQLLDRQKAGEVLYFLRQVPFYLPGGIRYVVDFMEVFKVTVSSCAHDVISGLNIGAVAIALEPAASLFRIPFRGIRFVDTKSKPTATASFTLKMRLLAECYPDVEIEIVDTVPAHYRAMAKQLMKISEADK